MSRIAQARTAAAQLTGLATDGAQAIGGHVIEVDLACGGTVVAKRHDEPSAVLAEVASLEWLAEPDGPPVPQVRGHDHEWLIMDQVEPGRSSAPAAEDLGRRLAALHATGAPTFGAAPPGGPVDAWIGLAPMRNDTGEDWPAWFAEHRIAPYVRSAVDAGSLEADDAAVLDEVCAKLDSLAGQRESPSRLHGDLWNGNVLWAADGRAWLIDPAAHGGHRESDLAMLALFGCAHLDRVLAAYDEAVPLADGWRERVPLHQLFPLLVHTVLFGGGYARSAVAAARAALRVA
ncbi:fructosamine-3-kinase [Herbihabitans rhizosphaerae]|uniref:Fructosamine-3-kinase n=1 Tax=Herbihabitans rhizosphaerae TaxID=1872711 RepID=A0A4Q7L4H6_9PSEU|nr:fructosamine kinase family protein [Herbihabitans rhizosphaerae]RZS44167.1 fructosamine-3-kinase [Herbihabitans rhizosphaerae]